MKQRAVYNGMIGFAWGLGAILGPVIAGAFATKATWRWAFFINLPLAGGKFTPLYALIESHIYPSHVAHLLPRRPEVQSSTRSSYSHEIARHRLAGRTP